MSKKTENTVAPVLEAEATPKAKLTVNGVDYSDKLTEVAAPSKLGAFRYNHDYTEDQKMKFIELPNGDQIYLDDESEIEIHKESEIHLPFFLEGPEKNEEKNILIVTNSRVRVSFFYKTNVIKNMDVDVIELNNSDIINELNRGGIFGYRNHRVICGHVSNSTINKSTIDSVRRFSNVISDTTIVKSYIAGKEEFEIKNSHVEDSSIMTEKFKAYGTNIRALDLRNNHVRIEGGKKRFRRLVISKVDLRFNEFYAEYPNAFMTEAAESPLPVCINNPVDILQISTLKDIINGARLGVGKPKLKLATVHREATVIVNQNDPQLTAKLTYLLGFTSGNEEPLSLPAPLNPIQQDVLNYVRNAVESRLRILDIYNTMS